MENGRALNRAVDTWRAMRQGHTFAAERLPGLQAFPSQKAQAQSDGALCAAFLWPLAKSAALFLYEQEPVAVGGWVEGRGVFGVSVKPLAGSRIEPLRLGAGGYGIGFELDWLGMGREGDD